jgi:branched-subunit amino acid aminotransferase/4-amino-4-deoxychorismate lyase
VKDGILLTPPLGLILSSISRRSVLEAAPIAGIKAVERPIRREELLAADEIFSSSTSRRVLPVSRIEDRVLAEVPGPVSRRLAALMEAICSGRDERYKRWFQPIE